MLWSTLLESRLPPSSSMLKTRNLLRSTCKSYILLLTACESQTVRHTGCKLTACQGQPIKPYIVDDDDKILIKHPFLLQQFMVHTWKSS